MNVFSVFDGMSTGQIALNKAGIVYDKYYASEINKDCIKVTQTHFPKTIQLGDISKINIKLLSLLEVYKYLSVYDTNIQSKLSEWEMLYWIDKKFTITAYFGTQKPNEGRKISESSSLQCIEKIRFSKRELGNFIKTRNIEGSGSNGNKIDCGNSNELQCGEWRYGYDMERRNFSKNIGRIEEKSTNAIGRNKEKNINNIEGEIFRPEGKTTDFGENAKSNVARGCEKKLFGRSEENRCDGKVEKEKSDSEFETNRNVQNIIEELQKWNEIDRTSKTYENLIQFHSKTQVTLVEYEGGIILFNGKFELMCGGSPCQSFTNTISTNTGFDGKSKLFFEYIRLLKECKPKYFLLENVQMKKEWEDIITFHIGIEPVPINSDLFSAQSRPRLYWTNIPFGKLPESNPLVLNDILEPAVDKKYYYKELFEFHGYDKVVCATLHINGHDILKRVNSPYHKCQTLTAVCGGNQQKKVFENTAMFVRKLTPIEYERLQTIPENYTSMVSNSARYKMLGNGWTADLIAHIFLGLADSIISTS
jgi:DNA (cytosine-5)-methyltransferase 3A